MKKILISDVSLRDGNHAINHQIDGETIANYCKILNTTGVDICEIGHGNGIGASSLSIGRAKLNFTKSLSIAKKIVEMFNGRIWIESELGVGTTFFIELKKITI